MIKRTKFNDKKVFKEIEGNSTDISSLEAAIANFEGGTGGSVDLTELTARVDALENPVSISAFTITNPTTALEVGATLASLGISWAINNATTGNVRDITNSVDIHTINTSSGTATITGLSITKSTPLSNSFQLQVGSVNSTTRTVSWQWAMYYGNSANTTLTAEQAKALTKQLRSSAVGNYAIADATGYKHILIPKSITQPSGFKDSGTGFAVAMQAAVEVTITNDQGVEVVMNDYRTTNSFGGAITIEAVA